MRGWQTCVLMVAVLMSGARWCRAAQTPATQPGGAVRQALMGPTTAQEVFQIWRTMQPSVAAEAKKLLGVEDGLGACDMTTGDMRREEVQVTVRLSVKDVAKQAAAGELANAVLREMQRRFEDPAGEREKMLLGLRAELLAKARDARNEQQKLRSVLRDLTQRSDVSEEGLRQSMSKLDQEKQSLLIDLEALAARREALRQSIADQSKVMSERAKDDAILAELQKAAHFQAQQFELQKKMHESGRISAAELSAATASLAEARVKVLEREELSSGRDSSELLAAWNRELLNTSIDMAEKEARAKSIEKRLAVLLKCDAPLSQIEEAGRNSGLWQVELAALESRLGRLREEDAMRPRRWFVPEQAEEP